LPFRESPRLLYASPRRVLPTRAGLHLSKASDVSMQALIVPCLVAGAVLASHGVARCWTRAFPPIGAMTSVDGVALHYVDRPARAPVAGAPLPIVFLHGASGNLRDPLIAFGDRLQGRRLVFVDRPGHGHSARGGAASASPARQARLVKGVLDHLGIGRAVIVGHSLGAAVAATFALDFPAATAGLVFVAPASHPWGGQLPWYHRLMRLPLVGAAFAHVLAVPLGLALAPAMVRETFAPEPAPEHYMRRAGAYLVLRPGSFRANAGDVGELHFHLAALAPRYRDIAAPTTIVTGDRDAVVWAEIHAESLARDIAGARLIVLPGAGHMPHHTATAAVVDAIEAAAARAEA
jgi:pimeloyl-ACP methyl ester carboxylesterase